MPLKRGQIAEGKVIQTVFGGRGIVSLEGEPVFVKNVLPGQTIRFRIKKASAGKCEGTLLEVLEPSPEETLPDCPHFGACGGCSLRTLPYEGQLALKRAQVCQILNEACEDPHFEGVVPGPVVEGYRNKMEFSFGDERKDGPMTLGLHRRGSYYDILTVDQCRIVDEDFRRILQLTLQMAAESGMPYYQINRHTGYFRHLVVRKAYHTGEILVNLVTSSQADPAWEEAWLRSYAEALQGLRSQDEKSDLPASETSGLKGEIVGILHTVNDRQADVVFSDRTDILSGRAYFREDLLGLQFKISPFSFFQNNTAGAERLYSIVREYIGDTKDKTIYDLYSGTGTIAQVLAPVAGKVIGVEIVEEAVQAARENAAWNGLDNCSFIAGDVLKVLDELEDAPDLIVLDPPREGVHPKALRRIAAYGAERIVYISCKPTSLPEDLGILFRAGYTVARSCAVDMFCGTAHVETVCLLSKLSEAKNHISVKVEMDEMDLTAAESKATYQEIQEWVQEKYGFHVSHLNIAKTKRKCGIIERQNYNLPKSEDSRSPETPKEKEDAIIEAFKAFKMI